MERLEKVLFVIRSVGFSKSLDRAEDFPMTPELEIVEDADRLEAIGAIAVARTFTYGGKHKRPIYDPEIPFTEVASKREYRSGTNGSSIHHFFEKLLKLKDLLHTETGKKLGEPRHAYMEAFVERFLEEWSLQS